MIKHLFFEPSETSLKYRRNLIFSSVLCILHFGYMSLNELKVLDVSIPSELITLGLPLCMLWFGFNYFYLITTDLLQWKSQFLALDENTPINGAIWKDWESKTITCEIAKLTDKTISLNTSFYGNDGNISIKGTNQNIELGLKNLLADFRAGIKYDAERISKFEDSIQRYTLANRIKLYVLDFAVPGFMLIFSFSISVQKLF